MFDTPNITINTQKTIESPENSSSIHFLNEALKNDNLALILGAGVSMAYNLPSWDELLINTLVECFEDTDRNEAEKIAKAYYNSIYRNPIIFARFVTALYNEEKKIGKNEKTKEDFEVKLKSMLYPSGFNFKNENPTMDGVVALCKTKKVKNVITYNFDNLLEQKLEQEGIDFVSVYDKFLPKENDNKLRIYHVHGFAPQNNTDMFVKKVLDESEFHNQYTDMYNWQNITQLNIFRDYNCLFIGLSLTDSNSRRLLDIAQKQYNDKNKEVDKKHFWTGLEKFKDNFDPNLEAKSPDIFGKFSNIAKKAKQLELKSFDITPIWLKDYTKEGIGKVLEEIAKS